MYVYVVCVCVCTCIHVSVHMYVIVCGEVGEHAICMCTYVFLCVHACSLSRYVFSHATQEPRRTWEPLSFILEFGLGAGETGQQLRQLAGLQRTWA